MNPRRAAVTKGLSGRATRRCGTVNPERLPNHGARGSDGATRFTRTGLPRKPEQLSRRTRERPLGAGR